MRLSSTCLAAFFVSLVPSAVATPSPDLMIAFLKQFAEDWTFPRIVDVVKNITYPGWADDIIGRVDVTTTFAGNELNTEYIFGLWAGVATANTTQLIGHPINQTIQSLVIQGDTLHVNLIATFNWTVIVPVQFNVWFMFNDDGQVRQYDAEIVRSSWLFQYVTPFLIPPLVAELKQPIPTTAAEVASLISLKAATDICLVHQEFCTGSLKQYNSTRDCMKFIQTEIPFGEPWQGGQNTALCRYVHKAMLPLRPSVHCPHIGPAGGGMCIERDYVQVVTEKIFPDAFIQLPGNWSHLPVDFA